MPALLELEAEYEKAKKDRAFKDELETPSEYLHWQADFSIFR